MRLFSYKWLWCFILCVLCLVETWFVRAHSTVLTHTHTHCFGIRANHGDIGSRFESSWSHLWGSFVTVYWLALWPGVVKFTNQSYFEFGTRRWLRIAQTLLMPKSEFLVFFLLINTKLTLFLCFYVSSRAQFCHLHRQILVNGDEVRSFLLVLTRDDAMLVEIINRLSEFVEPN